MHQVPQQNSADSNWRAASPKRISRRLFKWSSGFEIGASDSIKGVTLKASFGSTAQTGYDTNAQMVFTFGHRGWICGTNRTNQKAALLVMRGNKTERPDFQCPPR